MSLNRIGEDNEIKLNNLIPSYVNTFSKGKTPQRNEDTILLDKENGIFIVADGATDSSGKEYDGKTGGEIASNIVVKEAQGNQDIGTKLVERINNSIKEFYNSNGEPPVNPFTSTMVVAKIVDGKLVITQVGDTFFRINGEKVYGKNDKLIDTITGLLRKKFIETFGIDKLDDSRAFILPIINKQYQFQNSSKEIIFNQELLNEMSTYIREGYKTSDEIEKIFKSIEEELTQYFGRDITYGAIDGKGTPDRLVKEHIFNIEDIKSLEIFSDGYHSVPDGTDLEDWENMHEKTEKVDPYKYQKYPSTKAKDDRSVLIASFGTKNIAQERNELLSLNYDDLYGAYEVVNENGSNMEFKLLDNCLITFQNKLEKLQGLQNNPNITILDLKALSQGIIKVIHGPEINEGSNKIVMCTGGTLDLLKAKNSKGESNVHMLTSLRDAGGTSVNKRCTVGGRFLHENVRKTIEIESSEESPILGKLNGEFYLAIGNEHYEYLIQSIRLFLSTKYDPTNIELKKMFERGFRGLKYEELGKVLTDIIDNNRIVKFKSKDIYPKGLEQLKRDVKIGDVEDSFYVLHNKDMNTYVFMLIKQFEGFPEGFKVPGKRPNRLFLESYNQSPKSNRLSDIKKVDPSAVGILSDGITNNIHTVLDSISQD